MRWIFDMDGTLVATREAHLAAYLAAGCRPPPDFHVRPWQEWCSQEVHDTKSQYLPRFLANYSHTLPAMRILEAMGGEILTNASRASYDATVAVFPLLRQYRAQIEMSPADKLAWLLHEQGDSRQPGFYLDDSPRLVEEVRRLTRWQSLDISGL